jgi:hypothetical protein
MAEHIWTVLCERHLIDPDSKVISLIDVSESVRVDGLEQQIEDALRLGKRGALVNAPTQLVSWWFRSDSNEESLQVRFVLVSPDGKRLFEQPMNALWGEDRTFLRVFFKFDKLPVSMPGLYWFVTEQQRTSKSGKARWIAMTRIPLQVDKV